MIESLSDDDKESIIVIQADVTDPQQVETMVEQVTNTFGKIDIAIHNSGIVKSVPSVSMSYEDWKKVLDVNLTGVFLCARSVGRQMIKQQHGVILNIGSMSGTIVNTPQPQISYNASKAGVIQLSKSLAMEWAKYNIRVNTLSPGYIDTDFTVQDLVSEWKWHIPLQRLGDTSELQALALFLASDASSYVTGANYILDGGYTSI